MRRVAARYCILPYRYTALKGGLYRYLLRHCRDPAAAEVMFQEVWMNVIRARLNYEVSAKFTTFFYRLAHNRLIDHYRKRTHGATVSLDDDNGPAVDEPIAPSQHQPESSYATRQQMEHFMNWPVCAGERRPKRRPRTWRE